MFKWMTLVVFVVALGLVPVRAQEKPALVVHAFTLASAVQWHYDMNQLQTEAITALKAKCPNSGGLGAGRRALKKRIQETRPDLVCDIIQS